MFTSPRKTLLLFGALLVGGCASTRPLPQPTEHVLADRAEAQQKYARKAWMAYMHRAPEGVDWQAVERRNGQQEQARRAALIGQGQRAQGDGRWEEVGSNNQSGRMHCGALAPGGDVLYGGSALGGLWRLGGDQGWQPLGDNLYGGAHEVIVIPARREGEPDTLLVTTDDGLVNVSRDDGASWETPEGLEGLTAVRGAALMDDDTSTVLIYAHRPGLRTPPALYVSVDLGRSFERRWSADGAYYGWMWAPRVGEEAATTAYVVHRGSLLRCDAPAFTCQEQGAIARGSDTAILAGSEAGAPTLYAALGSRGSYRLHRSDDAGQTWEPLRALGDFWATLAASTQNPDHVMYGGVELWRSTNGGRRFRKVNAWADYYEDPKNKLHADIHGIHCWPHPDEDGGEQCSIATDGGLYLTDNFGATVENISLSGLGVGQYYSTLTAASDPTRIAAGSQDQGYQIGEKIPPTLPGPSTPLEQIISGDYGHLTSSSGDDDLVYATYPGFVLAVQQEGSPGLYLVEFPSDLAATAWLPPIVADPLNGEAFFFAGDRLWRYTRTSEEVWLPALHAPATFPGEAGQYISALAFSPTQPSQLWATTDQGYVFRSDDRGASFQAKAYGAPLGSYLYGHALAIHPADSKNVVVGGSGYDGPAAYRTTDGGDEWAALEAGLPQTFVYGLAYAPNGDLYAATQAGAFRWRDGASQWENIMGTSAPITLYWSVEVVGEGELIRFGTYGRGIWDFIPDNP